MLAAGLGGRPSARDEANASRDRFASHGAASASHEAFASAPAQCGATGQASTAVRGRSDVAPT